MTISVCVITWSWKQPFPFWAITFSLMGCFELNAVSSQLNICSGLTFKRVTTSSLANIWLNKIGHTCTNVLPNCFTESHWKPGRNYLLNRVRNSARTASFPMTFRARALSWGNFSLRSGWRLTKPRNHLSLGPRFQFDITVGMTSHQQVPDDQSHVLYVVHQRRLLVWRDERRGPWLFHYESECIKIEWFETDKLVIQIILFIHAFT